MTLFFRIMTKGILSGVSRIIIMIQFPPTQSAEPLDLVQAGC